MFRQHQQVTLSRPEENSPNKLHQFSDHPVIEFKRFANRALEADTIAEKIMNDIHNEVYLLIVKLW